MRAAATKRDSLLLHGAIVFVAGAAASLFNYLFYMLIGRRVGVVDYGEVTSLASALLVLGAPAIVGQLVIARIVAALEQHGEQARLRRLAERVTLWSLAACAALVALAIPAAPAIARFFNLSQSAPIVAMAAGTGFFWVGYLQRGLFQGSHLFGDYGVSLLIEALAKVVLGTLLVVPFGTTGAIGGLAVALGLAVGYNTVRAAFVFPRGQDHDADAVDVPVLRIISGVGLGQITITLLTFYDVPLVKHVFDAHAAGLYSAAALVGRAVIGAGAFVPTLILPKAAARAATGRSSLPLLLAGIAVSGGIGAAAVLAGLVAPARLVTLIAGGSFGAAAPIVAGYALASTALAVANVVASYNFGLHRYGFVVPALVCSAAEIVTLAVWHPSPAAVVSVLAVGHAAVLLVTLGGALFPRAGLALEGPALASQELVA